MLTTTRLTRTIAVAGAVAALGPGTALARPADAPPAQGGAAPAGHVIATDLRSPDAVDAAGLVRSTAAGAVVRSTPAVTDRRSPDAIDAATAARPTPPRVEGIGVRPPATTPVVPQAVPLTQPGDSGGIDGWSLAIGAAAMLALLLSVSLLRSHRPHVRRIRAHA